MLELLLAASIAALTGMLSVPLVIRAARARGLLDRPDEGRRWHLVAVPRLGGIAVWVGAASGFTTLMVLGGGTSPSESQRWLAVAFLGGLALTFGVGMYDDLRGMSPRAKFAAQCAAAVILVAGGFRLESVALTSDVVIHLGWLGLPATLLWIVGVTNAFNLIDGLDGLAGGVAVIGLVCTGLASVLLGNPMVLALIVPLAASLCGFLRYNVSPARIFLGDVGSLTLGLTLAVLTVEGTRRPDGAVFFPVALCAVAFPLLDTFTAMLRRWLRGVPVTSADDRHVHHQLVALGLSHWRAAALIWLFAAAIAGFGLSVSLAPPTVTLLVSGLGAAAFVLVIVHGAKWLHYHEFAEAQASFTSGMRMARSVIRDRIRAREVATRLQAAQSLEDLGRLLNEHAGDFGFESIGLYSASSVMLRPYAQTSGGADILRLEWPILDPAGPTGRELILAVMWRRTKRVQSLYAERVVSILAPAIAAVAFDQLVGKTDVSAARERARAVTPHRRLTAKAATR